MNETDAIFYLNSIAQVIYDKKGSNILALDVRECSSLTDYVIIAEGASDKHVIAIAHAIMECLKKDPPLYVEGIRTGDWVAIDYFNIMIHLFKPGLRDKYQLEQLWREGDIVDLQINILHPSRLQNSGN